MTHHDLRGDKRRIEDVIEEDREKLSTAFQSLLGGATAEYLSREALTLLRNNAATYTHAVESAIRANPTAAVMAGAGLAWLVFGRRPAAEPVREVKAAATKVRDAATNEADRWAEAVDGLRGAASARLRKLEEDARASLDGLKKGETAADARDYLSERAEVLAELAEGMRKRFADGLEDLSSAARQGIVTAREEAYAARLRAEAAMVSGGRKTRQAMEDHPMVTAAVALTLGAALGAALNRRS